MIGSAEGGVRTLDTAHRALRDQPYAGALKAERAADRAKDEYQEGIACCNRYRFVLKHMYPKSILEIQALLQKQAMYPMPRQSFTFFRPSY